MIPTLTVLLGSAASVAFLHTLIGIDHSLPFIVLSKSEGWTYRKTMFVTGLCGVGHVLSSVILGFIGIGFGLAANRLMHLETHRGVWASWLLIGFGLAYMAWSILRRSRGRSHRHPHVHIDGTKHSHDHTHDHDHIHAHHDRRLVTTWTLFIIFIFGPCEPLIPLVMAAQVDFGIEGTVLVSAVFGAVTIGTMIGLVSLGYRGLQWHGFRSIENWADVLAGLAIVVGGVIIKIFGL